MSSASAYWYVLVRLDANSGHHSWLIHSCGITTYATALMQAAQFTGLEAAERRLIDLEREGQFGLVVRRVDAVMSDDESGRLDPR